MFKQNGTNNLIFEFIYKIRMSYYNYNNREKKYLLHLKLRRNQHGLWMHIFYWCTPMANPMKSSYCNVAWPCIARSLVRKPSTRWIKNVKYNFSIVENVKLDIVRHQDMPLHILYLPVKRLICTQATMKLSKVSFRVRESYFASKFWTNVGVNRYPICWNAAICNI